jgi:hypothetical protein
MTAPTQPKATSRLEQPDRQVGSMEISKRRVDYRSAAGKRLNVHEQDAQQCDSPQNIKRGDAVRFGGGGSAWFRLKSADSQYAPQLFEKKGGHPTH